MQWRFQTRLSFQFKAPSTDLRDAWVSILQTTIRSVVAVGGANPASQDYTAQERNYVIASLADIAKGPSHIVDLFEEELARRSVQCHPSLCIFSNLFDLTCILFNRINRLRLHTNFVSQSKRW